MKLIKYLFFALAISSTVLSGLTYLYRYGYNQYNAYDQSQLQEIISGKENYDILFIGSSRTKNHVDPYIIDSITGLNSFNAGVSGANLFEMNLMLQCYLQQHTPPKYVVADLALNAFNVDQKPIFNPSRYYNFLEDSIVSLHLEQDNKPNLLRHFPFLQFTKADDELILGAVLGLLGKKAPQKNFHKGYAATGTDTISMPHKTNFSYNCVIDRSGIELLKQIISTCREKNIKFVLTYSPQFFTSDDRYSDFFSTIEKLCAENDIPFRDYRSLPLFRDHKMFYDPIHLNRKGSVLFSEQLGMDIYRLRGGKDQDSKPALEAVDKRHPDLI